MEAPNLKLYMEQLILEDLTSLPAYHQNSIFSTDLSSTSTGVATHKNPDSKNELIMDAKNRAFKGYFGTYYCYLFPTLSSETKPLIGELTVADDDSICKVYLKLNTNKKDHNSKEYIYKNYEGNVTISPTLHSCYCILKSDALSEICFFAFRHINFNHAQLDCRMAEVLTISAGESHYPTIHRMFFSREAIADKDLPLILPHLFLNSSNILIKESLLNELQEKKLIPSAVFTQLTQTCTPEPFYLFQEDYVHSLLKHTLSKNDKKQIQTCLSFLKKYSLSYHYNKVSKKVDHNIRQLLLSLGYFSN
ncbi:MAG: hypothetical protein HFI74_04475 [Lachnospiraceae bacterium]|jgi:hypothetical protein|nr:hypothetical protein [Lachnospiraceae bacterium]